MKQNNFLKVIVAQIMDEVAGHVLQLPNTISGPYKNNNIKKLLI